MIALLAALVFSSPALASTDTIADETPAQECTKPDDIKARATNLIADLSGDSLKKFNANYARLTKQPVPDVDRVLVLGSEKNPLYMLLAFRDGCSVGVAPFSKASYEKLTEAVDDGSI